MQTCFYTYVFFRPNGIPCYVGKGKSGRLEKHVAAAKRGSSTNRHLANIIRKSGGSIPGVITRSGLTEAQAFETEIALIAAIGREANGGPLVNLTDGGEGPSGMKHSEETLKKMRAASLGRKFPPGSRRAKTDAERLHLAETSRAMWADPATKERIMTAQQNGRDDEARENHKRAIKASWTDERKAASSDIARQSWQNIPPETMAALSTKRSVLSVEMWNDADRRKVQSEKAKERWSNPDFVERCSKAQATRWANLSEADKTTLRANLSRGQVRRRQRETTS